MKTNTEKINPPPIMANGPHPGESFNNSRIPATKIDGKKQTMAYSTAKRFSLVMLITISPVHDYGIYDKLIVL